MQHVNDHKIRDYDLVLDNEFGAPGTKEREAAEKEAYKLFFEQYIDEMSLSESDTIRMIQLFSESINEVLQKDVETFSKIQLELDKINKMLVTIIKERFSSIEEQFSSIEGKIPSIEGKISSTAEYLNSLRMLFESLDVKQEGEVIRLVQEKVGEDYITIE